MEGPAVGPAVGPAAGPQKEPGKVRDEAVAGKNSGKASLSEKVTASGKAHWKKIAMGLTATIALYAAYRFFAAGKTATILPAGKAANVAAEVLRKA